MRADLRQGLASDTAEAARVFQPGDVFRDHYLVERFLGEGASGQVYGVRHRFTGDRFALKVAHLEQGMDRETAKRMARALAEAKAVHDIRHRNVVRVLDLACEEDGMVWQLQELLDGCSLARLLAAAGKLSPVYAVEIALEIVSGIQAAHEHLIIHRDIKPANVIITSAGVVKVIDFSLAKVIPSDLQTTLGKYCMGTAAYMGPEHIKDLPATPQFDVYAVGILLWQMLTGRHPFASALANEFQLVACQLKTDPESLVTAAGLPAYCDDVIRGATAKDPAQRYTGMWPLARALADLRQRLLDDIATGHLAVDPSLYEGKIPLQRDPEGHHQYSPPRSLPAEEQAPHLPSTRVVVAEADPVVKRSLAATMPMSAVSLPPAALLDAAAPTVRGLHPPAPPLRRLRALLVAPPLLAGLGLGAWMLAGDHPAAPTASTGGAATGSATVTAPQPRSSPPPPQAAPSTASVSSARVAPRRRH